MKKPYVMIVLVLAVALGLYGAPQQTPPPAAGAAQGTTAAGAPAQAQQKKEIKDPAEYNAYLNALNQTDPNTKINAMEGFLTQYPNSVMKEDALELLMATYEQTGNTAKTTETANRLLQVNPNNLRVLALLAYNARRAAEAGQNPQQNLATGSQYAQRGLQALNSAVKPEGMNDADWAKLKTQTSVIFNGVIGMAALQQKDNKTAQQYFQAAVTANPNNLSDVYPLALAYLTATPPDDVNGLWYIARAASLAAGSPAQAQITSFGRNRYMKYHGKEEGWNELLAAARTSPTPPPGFTIKPRPTPAEEAADLVQSKPVSKMSFDEMQLVFTSGNQQAATQVWSQLKDKPIAIEGKLISATPTKLMIAGTVDDIQANKADIELTMAAAVPARLAPKVGSTIQFEGVPTSYDANPFLMHMSKGLLLTKAPAAPAKKTTPRRR